MEFILNNKKYSIINHELFINYLMVDSYFKQYSKYSYNISFDFLNPILKKEKIEFKDIEKGAEYLEELIKKGEVNFIAPGVSINQIKDKFEITYQDLKFKNVSVSEAIPLLIALYSLLNAKPIVVLGQIKEELDYFLEKFRQYPQ